MRSTQRIRWILAAVAATPMFGIVLPALADTPLLSFTAGDLVVLRGGDATNSNNPTTTSAGEVSVYLDEYTPAGTYVGTIPVGSGLTLPGYLNGGVSHEGGLNLSVDGHYLTFGGYTDPAGPAARLLDGTQTEVIGRIGNTASSLDTTTRILPAQGTGQAVHAVTSVDGNQFYVSGKSPNAGLKYVSGVGASATVTTLQGTTDWRNTIIANNTLYGGTGSSSVGTHGAFRIGSFGTLPTAATPVNTLMTNYSGGNSASSLALINVTTSDSSAKSENGFNTLYTIGDQQVGPGITKYYFDGTNWQHTTPQALLTAVNNVSNPTGLIAMLDPDNSSWVDIFVSGQNGVYSYIDKSGDPLTGIAANSFTQIITPMTSDMQFYGVALAPVAVPEPATLSLAAIAALGLLRRSRRTR